jgi:hypothetical protein
MKTHDWGMKQNIPENTDPWYKVDAGDSFSTHVISEIYTYLILESLLLCV